MIIGIIGSRRRTTKFDKQSIENELVKILNREDNVEICSGHCYKGGDKFAEELAEKYDLKIILFPADWERYGKIAGFIRNTDIAKTSEILIATPAYDRKGGTEDTIAKFQKFHPYGRLILV